MDAHWREYLLQARCEQWREDDWAALQAPPLFVIEDGILGHAPMMRADTPDTLRYS